MAVAIAKKKQPRALPHAFEPDDALPADWQGRRVCAACRKPGAEGDPQHPVGALPLALTRFPPTPPEVREFEQRQLGEAE